jgi:uncharacterized protein (TIGR03437 family)
LVGDNPITLGVKFRSDVSGSVTGVRFYKGSGNNGTHIGMLYSSTGALLAQATFTGETASGWQQVNFSSPVAISANTTYVAAFFSNSGHAGDGGYFTSKGLDNAPLHALKSGVDGPNGLYMYGSAPLFPSQSWADSNYWVDIVFSTGQTSSVQISSLTCPANLGPNASGTCTVTLTGTAPAGGAAVALTNTNTVLTAPVSVTVAAGLTSATFNVTTAGIASNQSATVTATYNATSASATVGLVASMLVSSLACPANLGPNASGTCTVTLTQVAPAGGAVVSLTSNQTALTVPASVTVAGGVTTGAFNAATGTLASNLTATVTASYNSSSAPATINLVATIVVSSLTCNPTSLGPNATSSCTVTLSNPAPGGGAVVSLTSNNPLLTTPASVTVLAGSTTAAFTATAGNITVSQTGSVTAGYNGSSQPVSISLVPLAVQVTSLLCNLTGLMSAGTTTCTATLSQTVAANTPVSLTSSSPLLSVPAGVTVPAGSNSAGFSATAGTISTDASGVITATLGTASKTVTLALWSTPTLVALTCSPTALTVGASSTCTVILSKAAGAIAVGIAASDPALSTPASATVPLGAVSVAFTVTAQSLPKGWIVLTATWNSLSKSALLTVSAPSSSQSVTSPVQASSISCTPKTLPAGGSGICQIGLDGVMASSTAELQLSSSSDSIKLPATITTRPGQSSVQFQIDAAPAPTEQSAVITARLGAEVVQETVAIGLRRRSGLSTPSRRLVKYGTEVRFSVFNSDPGAGLSVTALPPGASFDAASGAFDWIPTAAQQGIYEVVFNALSPTGEVITERVELEVDSGAPAITRVINAASHSQDAACSPGAIGRLEGKWLSDESAAESDASGGSLRLSGTAVMVNGDAVPILYASATRVDFLCPASVPGSQLQIVVETAGGRSQASQTTARELAPGLFSIDGSDRGQGMALHAGGSSLVMVRNYHYAAQPAQPGDVIAIYATGMEGLSKASVRIGNTEVEADSLDKVPGLPGLWLLSVTVPQGEVGNAVGLSISRRMSNEISVSSNQIRIAIEAPGR